MKQMWLVGALASVFFVAQAAAMSSAQTQGGGTNAQVPSGETVLGTVSIPRAVTADGKPLPAGRYTLRLTADAAQPAPGQAASLERWVEFVRGGKVVGRELASIVPAEEVKDTMPGPDMPGRVGRSGARVEMLKGGEYLRVWVARGGHNYLLHLPPAGGAAK
jgi:hypothetical protein